MTGEMYQHQSTCIYTKYALYRFSWNESIFFHIYGWF